MIETTGPADPVPIIHTLMTHTEIVDRYRLAGIVTTIDTAMADATLDRHAEAIKQAAIADCLLLTKGDFATQKTRRWEVTNDEIAAARLVGLGLLRRQPP